jgi:hypothetical protein
MKRLMLVTLTASLLAISGASLAQTQPEPAPDAGAQSPDAGAPAKAPAKAKPRPNPGEVLRRTTCRQQVDQALKGPDLKDAMEVCMLEARLNCLKKAVEDKVRGKQRQTFMSTCSGGG